MKRAYILNNELKNLEEKGFGLNYCIYSNTLELSIEKIKDFIGECGIFEIEAKPEGKVVTLKEFMGDLIDIYYEEKNDPERSIRKFARTATCYEVKGYGAAFFAPPWSHELSFDSDMEKFHSINKKIFGAMSDDNLFIVEWNTDFSPFFEEHDYWRFFWTVHSKETNFLTFIYGSGTD